jgi:mRNA interferase MazF
MKKGDVVLIKFPFTDLTGSKLRPALVLFESGDDVVVSFITSVLTERFSGDVKVIKSEQNGLKKDSILRLVKLATLSKSLIAGKLGIFSQDDLKAVNHGLRDIFQI